MCQPHPIEIQGPFNLKNKVKNWQNQTRSKKFNLFTLTGGGQCSV